MPCSSRAFCTRQHGPAFHGIEHRCSLTATLGAVSLLLRLALVQRHGGADELLQRLLIYGCALMEVDRAPRVAFEARVEKPRRIIERCALRERHLHDVLVGLARADDPGVGPHRNASPFPFLDDFWIGIPDDGTEPSEHLAPPVVELLDPSVDELRG